MKITEVTTENFQLGMGLTPTTGQPRGTQTHLLAKMVTRILTKLIPRRIIILCHNTNTDYLVSNRVVPEREYELYYKIYHSNSFPDFDSLL